LLNPIHCNTAVTFAEILVVSSLVVSSKCRNFQSLYTLCEVPKKHKVFCSALSAVGKDTSRNQFGDRCFATTGPTLWNRLPEQLWQPDITFGQFKRSFKMFVWLVGSRHRVSER